MKNLLVKMICISMFVISVISCSHPTDSRDNNIHDRTTDDISKESGDPAKPRDHKIYARVTDANGNPLENVGIHFFSDCGATRIHGDQVENKIVRSLPSEYQLTQNYPNPFSPLTSIQFSLPHSGHVQLIVMNWWNSNKVRTLIDKELSAGNHKVIWDGKNDNGQSLSNNIYTYQLTSCQFTEQKELFLNETDPEQIGKRNSIPLATSDSQGDLELEYDVLPIGKSVKLTDAIGNELPDEAIIPDFLNFVFTKEGYKPISQKVIIDTSQVLDISIILEE